MKFKIKLDDIILYLVFTELILGGTGRLFNHPVRIGLFAISFAIAIYYFYKNDVKINKITWMYIVSIILYAAYGSVIGLIRGNNLKDILSNINVFISIFYVILFLVFINGRKEKISKLINLFVIYNVVLAVVVFIVFAWSYYGIKAGYDVVKLLEDFQSFTQYGLITGALYSNTYVRVYIANGIFMQVALAICLVKLAYKNKFSVFSLENVSILILVLGIFSTNTRGYWVGTAVVIILLIFFIKGSNKRKLLANLLVVLVGVSVIYVAVFTHKKDQTNVVNQAVNRVHSTTEFSNAEISNNVRGIQMKYLLNSIKKHPILGSGFGARIEGYGIETKRNTLNFEMYYFELWFKTGTIGMIFLLAGILHLLYRAIKLSEKLKGSTQGIILKGWTLGFISVLVSGGTNPYFAGAYGFFNLAFLIILTDIFCFGE